MMVFHDGRSFCAAGQDNLHDREKIAGNGEGKWTLEGKELQAGTANRMETGKCVTSFNASRHMRDSCHHRAFDSPRVHSFFFEIKGEGILQGVVQLHGDCH